MCEDRTLQFTCQDLGDGGTFPLACTGRGENISPEFVIRNLSPRAKTLAITLEDLSHPIRNFTHWVIWNLPAEEIISRGIPAGKQVPSRGGAVQGTAYGLHRYAGPKPPKGKTHLYRFTLYSLSVKLELSPRAGKKAFLRQAQPHILQAGTITGNFTS